MSVKVWFITGASKGFGREWAEAALERGDRVAATSRNAASLAPLVEKYGDAVLPVELDGLDEAAGYATDWAGPSAIHAERNPAYDDFRAGNAPRPSGRRGDPAATRAAILAVVDAPEPPLRIFLGPAPLPVIRQEYAARISEW